VLVFDQQFCAAWRCRLVDIIHAILQFPRGYGSKLIQIKSAWIRRSGANVDRWVMRSLRSRCYGAGLRKKPPALADGVGHYIDAL